MNSFIRIARDVVGEMAVGGLGADAIGVYILLTSYAPFSEKSTAPPGVWVGSLRELAALESGAAKKNASRRALQSALDRLEVAGFIKRFPVTGPANHTAFVLDGFMVGQKIVSAKMTTDWKQPELVQNYTTPGAELHQGWSRTTPGVEQNYTRPGVEVHQVHEQNPVLTGVSAPLRKEERKEREEGKTETAASLSPSEQEQKQRPVIQTTTDSIHISRYTNTLNPNPQPPVPAPAAPPLPRPAPGLTKPFHVVDYLAEATGPVGDFDLRTARAAVAWGRSHEQHWKSELAKVHTPGRLASILKAIVPQMPPMPPPPMVAPSDPACKACNGTGVIRTRDPFYTHVPRFQRKPCDCRVIQPAAA